MTDLSQGPSIGPGSTPTNTGPVNITANGQTVAVNQPTAQGQYGAVVVSNASPYLCAVSTGQPGQWLQAWSADVFAVPAGSNPLEVTSIANSTGGAVTVGAVTASWYWAGQYIPGTYPLSLTAQAIAGTVTAAQGQLELIATGIVTFSGSGTQTFGPITIPAGIHINALQVLVSNGGTGNWHGIRAQLLGDTSGLAYYDGRPWANLGEGGYFGMEPAALVPFAGDFEQTLTLDLISTGASGMVEAFVIGYEGVVPAFTPPVIPGETAHLNFTSPGGGGSSNLLPALTDGRQYVITSASLSGTGGCFMANTAGVPFLNLTVGISGTTAEQNYAPDGYNAGIGPITIGAGTAGIVIDGSVTYRYF